MQSNRGSQPTGEPSAGRTRGREKAITPSLAGDAQSFRKALRDWYLLHHRPLPWRTEPSLYRTVVSEMMLQQTRIDTALPYFHRWMEALPDFATLAAAPEEQILKLWEGLGYYRRARNLQRLAQELIRLEEIPRTADAWQRFPGIGPYSAAAITSIAFGAPAACVDGNVVRVLSRIAGYDAPLKDTTSAARIFQPLAQQLLDPGDPGLHNQAMMELGATACQRKPDCASCPVAGSCKARQSGTAEQIPNFPSRKIEKVAVTRIWTANDGHLLLSKPTPKARRLSQLYELPACEQLGLSSAYVQKRGKLILRKRRAITRFSVTESIYALPREEKSSPQDGLAWVPLKRLDQIALSGPHRRWIEAILAQTSG